MNINIIVSVENEIVAAGLTTILQEGVLGAVITNVKKRAVFDTIELGRFDIAIIELTQNIGNCYSQLECIARSEKIMTVFAFLQNKPEPLALEFLKSHNIDLILKRYSQKRIIHKLKNSLDSRAFYNIRKLDTLSELLSRRELEIGFMLANGLSISEISNKKNLAGSTVSTYKKRIFSKMNVKNLIEMSRLFKRAQLQNTKNSKRLAFYPAHLLSESV